LAQELQLVGYGPVLDGCPDSVKHEDRNRALDKEKKESEKRWLAKDDFGYFDKTSLMLRKGRIELPATTRLVFLSGRSPAH